MQPKTLFKIGGVIVLLYIAGGPIAEVLIAVGGLLQTIGHSLLGFSLHVHAGGG